MLGLLLFTALCLVSSAAAVVPAGAPVGMAAVVAVETAGKTSKGEPILLGTAPAAITPGGSVLGQSANQGNEATAGPAPFDTPGPGRTLVGAPTIPNPATSMMANPPPASSAAPNQPLVYPHSLRAGMVSAHVASGGAASWLQQAEREQAGRRARSRTEMIARGDYKCCDKSAPNGSGSKDCDWACLSCSQDC